MKRRLWVNRRKLLLKPAARPFRFAGTGSLAAGVQLSTLIALTHAGWNSLEANGLAFLLAAQINFALSSAFTWRGRITSRSPIQQWILFHTSIAGMAVLNMIVFAIARPLVPAVAASMMGIVAGAVGNYLAGDRLVFRESPTQISHSPQRRSAA